MRTSACGISLCLWMVLPGLLSGCATMINTPSQSVSVSTSPPGAVVRALGEDGEELKTPAVLRLSRKGDHVLVIRKEGYREERVALRHATSRVAGLNAFFLGLTYPVDVATGAQFRLVPAEIHVDLLPETSDASSTEVRNERVSGRPESPEGERP